MIGLTIEVGFAQRFFNLRHQHVLVAQGAADDDGVEGKSTEAAAKFRQTEVLEPASSVGAGDDDEDGVPGAGPETDDDECEREAERIAKWFTS